MQTVWCSLWLSAGGLSRAPASPPPGGDVASAAHGVDGDDEEVVAEPTRRRGMVQEGRGGACHWVNAKADSGGRRGNPARGAPAVGMFCLLFPSRKLLPTAATTAASAAAAQSPEMWRWVRVRVWCGCVKCA